MGQQTSGRTRYKVTLEFLNKEQHDEMMRPVHHLLALDAMRERPHFCGMLLTEVVIG